MANEEKKDFNAMLHDSKDMPKFQMITDPKTIERYGGNRMYFAPPIDYDKVMKQVPFGKVITVGKIREYFAKVSGAEAQKEKLEAEGQHYGDGCDYCHRRYADNDFLTNSNLTKE